MGLKTTNALVLVLISILSGLYPTPLEHLCVALCMIWYNSLQQIFYHLEIWKSANFHRNWNSDCKIQISDIMACFQHFQTCLNLNQHFKNVLIAWKSASHCCKILVANSVQAAQARSEWFNQEFSLGNASFFVWFLVLLFAVCLI